MNNEVLFSEIIHENCEYTWFNSSNIVCVTITPDGQWMPCMELSDSYSETPKFWCGGRVGNSPEELENLLWDHWNDPNVYDNMYERQERSFTERFNDY